MNITGRLACALLLCVAAAPAQKRFHTYVGDLAPDRVLLAWGTTEGGSRNTIGRASVSHGPAVVTLNGRHEVTSRNWVEVTGLQPDTVYPYTVAVSGRVIGQGEVRTHPTKATALDFFVIGDYGNGSAGQREVARAMAREFERLKRAGTPVRFVMTVGDNIYTDTLLGVPTLRRTGDQDSDWGPKHFEPYRPLLREVPFYAIPGNHDGKESEREGDFAVLFDNFFYPGNRPARHYSFGFGGLAEFFALDTSRNSGEPLTPQFQWLATALGASHAPWKIVVGHHPPYNAGPRHGGDRERLMPALELMAKHRAAAYFCGHEHNFQVSTRDTAMAPAVMFLTGAGGELRSGNPRGAMAREHISAWAAVRHFLHVRIEGETMRVTPIGAGRIQPVDAAGRPVPIPFTLNRP